MARKPGTLGRIHITNERSRRFPDLYGQDAPVRGSVATRRAGAITYVGPFGLWLFVRDTERILRAKAEAPPDMWHPDLERGFSRCDYQEQSKSDNGPCFRRCTKAHGHTGQHVVGGWALECNA